MARTLDNVVSAVTAAVNATPSRQRKVESARSGDGGGVAAKSGNTAAERVARKIPVVARAIEASGVKPVGRSHKAVRAARVFEVLSKSNSEHVLPRWTGGQPATIDAKLVKQCTVGSSGGTVTNLNFHFKFLSKMTGLQDYGSNLISLDLSSNNIRRMEGMNECMRLQVLNLAGCEIHRIESLEFCSSLTALYLQDNRITAVEGLGGLRALECLNLDSNRIVSAGRGFASLLRLKELYLSHNLLSSLDGFTGLKNLETLGVSGNRLQAISASQLNGLEKLDELRLAGNGLQNLKFLAKLANAVSKPVLPRLATLDVASNRLTENQLQEIPKLSRLTELDLSGNKITLFPEQLMAKLPTIEILDLSQNLLESAKELEELTRAVALRELFLHGNPGNLKLRQSDDCTPDEQAEEDPLEVLILALPALQLLDGDPVPKKQALAGTGTGNVSLGGTFHLTSTLNGGYALSSSVVEKPPPKPSNLPRLPKHRYAAEEQVEKWEQRVMNEFACIGRHVGKTVQRCQSDLDDMDHYIRHCREVLQRERERKQPSMKFLREPNVPRRPQIGKAALYKGLVELDVELDGHASASSSRVKSSAAAKAETPPPGLRAAASKQKVSPTAKEKPSAFDNWRQGPTASSADGVADDGASQAAASNDRGSGVSSPQLPMQHRSPALSKRSGCCSKLGRHVNGGSKPGGGGEDPVYMTAVTPDLAGIDVSGEDASGQLSQDEDGLESQEVVEELDGCQEVFHPSRDLEEVEEDIGEADDSEDNVDVKQAEQRLRCVRAAREHMKVCKLGIVQPKTRTPASLQSALPFPSLDNASEHLRRARVG